MNRKPLVSNLDCAAILMMSLESSEAAEIMRHLGPKQVQRLGSAMAALSNVDKEKVDYVLNEFFSQIKTQTSLGIGSDDYIRKVLVDALGDDKANSIVDRILLGANTKGLETLKWMEPRAVADIIRNEHPQIQAIIISYLDSDHAAEVISFFDDRTKLDIIQRISAQETVQPLALQELNNIMERQFSNNGATQSKHIGGVKVAANIMNFVDSASEAKLMESLQNVDSDLAQKIQDLMFVFDNLIDIDDRGMQRLLREINNDTLLLALKGADEAMQEKIFKNMSERAAEMLKDDLEAKGPVKLSEVEGSQKEILTIARNLAESGEIVLGGAGGEEMVG